MSAGTVFVALKWVDLAPRVDRLSGAVATDNRTSGLSEADQAALEWGLRLAERWNWDVAALAVGPEEAEGGLRTALAAGASTAARASAPAALSSPAVAAALAQAVRTLRSPGAAAGALADGAPPDGAAETALVVCGDWSLDRGSGSVPPFLSAELGWAQACGLVGITPGEPGRLGAERRLDGGRREQLRVRAPAVISVEGSTARLRREPLGGLLAAGSADVRVFETGTGAGAGGPPEPAPARLAPYRPRARVLPGPDPRLSARERILALTGALIERRPPERLELGPPEAARRLLDALREWGVGTADPPRGPAGPG